MLLEISAKIGGKKRFFRFGMNANSIYQKMITSGQATTDQEMIIALFYAGLKSKELINKLPDDFSLDLVGDWIDEMEETEYKDVLAAAMEAFGQSGKRIQVAAELLMQNSGQ
jgi:hypothetical protein